MAPPIDTTNRKCEEGDSAVTKTRHDSGAICRGARVTNDSNPEQSWSGIERQEVE
jgi:hypothetical protein